MNCAAFVSDGGKGFPGQLGISSDRHLPGLTRLATALARGRHRVGGAAAALGPARQAEYTGSQPVCPWADAETGARALSTAEVSRRCRTSWTPRCAPKPRASMAWSCTARTATCWRSFLDATNNQREDRYGGSFENRARMLFDTIAGVRARTRPDFQLGLRLSPERFGIQLSDARELARQVLAGGQLDYLDLSLWDVFKEPQEPQHKGRPLIDTSPPAAPRHAAGRGRQADVGSQRPGLPGARRRLRADRPRRHPAPRLRAARDGRPGLPGDASAGDPGPPHGRRRGPAFIHYLKTEWRDFVAD